jgi:Papain family cysteine protease
VNKVAQERTPVATARLYTGVEPEPRSWMPFVLRRWAKNLFSARLKYPSSFNWDDKGVVPDPGDQGQVQACISYAGCLAASVTFRLKTGKAVSLAPRVMHFCTLGLGQGVGSNSVEFEEKSVASGLPVSADGGTATEASTMASQSQCAGFGSLPRLKVTGVRRFDTEEAVKYELSTAGPVVAYITLFDDFWNAYQPGTTYHAPPHASSSATHAVCLIGYDDARQCWIGVNSRGTSWGAKGRFLLKYGECNLLGKYKPVYSLTIQA